MSTPTALRSAPPIHRVGICRQRSGPSSTSCSRRGGRSRPGIGPARKNGKQLQPHDLAGADTLVSGKHDAERVDRRLVVLGEVDLATDRLEEEPLLTLAELLMAG